jgi:uncharacterized membrane protein
MVPAASKVRRVLLALIFTSYAIARVLQVITGPVPRYSLVALDVLSALSFALVDGARHYGLRGILIFALICAAVGNAVENIGVATGIRFGHYRFLSVKGPKILNVPVLLGLACIGMAYVSWSIGRILLGAAVERRSVFALPVVASFVMVAWDLAQDPVWSTFLHAWIWRDGGPWFGVPASNYFGWYITVFVIYLLFAMCLRRGAFNTAVGNAPMWPAVVFYALCAAGNVLQMFVAQPVSAIEDASGEAWRTADILAASALVSVFVMGSFAASAAVRMRRQDIH